MDFVTVGARVQERRKKFGMSVQALADRAGVARYTIIRLEEGKS
ncbi:XRE family transcriptional regulator, partial [bacterium]